MFEDRCWCLTARDAPVVLAIVRYAGEPRWTHLLRWDYERDELEPGAWTTMHVKAHRGSLSRDGRFLCYLAEGSRDGPFDRFYGGAWAISRAPWLAALTHPDTFGPGGGGESQHALSEAEQETLWAHVSHNDYGRPDWIDMLGPGWSLVHGERFEATHAIGGVGWTARAMHDDPGEFIFSPFEGRLAYTVVNERTGEALDEIDPTFHAADLRWAQPLPGGRLATIDRAGRLELRRFPGSGGAPTTIARHELAGRTPEPAESPTWARAPLARGELASAGGDGR
ncbi:MAG: hypothetical protein ACIAQU_13185 [Phycisphaerales bacterium JB064]